MTPPPAIGQSGGVFARGVGGAGVLVVMVLALMLGCWCWGVGVGVGVGVGFVDAVGFVGVWGARGRGGEEFGGDVWCWW